MNFPRFFPGKFLKEIPIFDARCVVYPDITILKDYLSWRQADCHINNLYNTCFWALVNQKGIGRKEAGILLNDMKADQKNEMLWKEFDINYNKIEEVWRKGSILIRRRVAKEKNGVIGGKWQEIGEKCDEIDEKEKTKDKIGEKREKSDNIEEKGEKETKRDKLEEKDEKNEEKKEKTDKNEEKREKTNKNEINLDQNNEKPDKTEKKCEKTDKKPEKIDKKHEKTDKSSKKKVIVILHEDLISDIFWSKYKEDLDYS